MVYLGEEKCKAAAKEIAQRFIETSSGMNSKITESGVRAELARLARLTEELSPQLQQETILLEYAKSIQQFLRNPESVNSEILRSAEKDLAQFVKFPAPANIVGLPEIKTFEFEVVTIAIEGNAITSKPINLQSFEFEVALIEVNK